MTAFELQQKYRKRLQDQKDDRAIYTFAAIVFGIVVLAEIWRYCAITYGGG